jgi:hypothetical protein
VAEQLYNADTKLRIQGVSCFKGLNVRTLTVLVTMAFWRAALNRHRPPHLHLVKIYKTNTSKCVKRLIPMHATNMTGHTHQNEARQKDILHQGVEPCSTAALVRIRYSDAS